MVRTDATVSSGTGHVMRCLALAQTWQQVGGEVAFIMADTTIAIQDRLRSEKMTILGIESTPGSADEIRQTIEFAQIHNAEWIVVDGYQFSSHYVSELQKARPVLLIDDSGDTQPYSADLVLNQNLHASLEMYRNRAPRTRLLLGPKYALIRREFDLYRSWERKVSKRGTRILLTMGGTDPRNLAPRILLALAELLMDDLKNEDLTIRVVVGGSAENLSDVSQTALRFPGRVEVMSNVENMAELMAWADFAIAGAGTTCWEMCLLGLPAILVVVAENQRAVSEQLDRVGAAINLGPAELLDVSLVSRVAAELVEDWSRRLEMSKSAAKLIDGLGSERVRAALIGRELNLRLVRQDDCPLLFELADEKVARKASFRSAPITWDDHVDWFSDRLKDPGSVIYIGEDAAGQAVGLVRFQINGERAVISVNVAQGFRGRGWGRELVEYSTNFLARDRRVRQVDAFVKPDNHASVRLFEASGFRRVATEKVEGQDAILFTWPGGRGTSVH